MSRARKPINEKYHKARRDRLTETFARREYLTSTTRKSSTGVTSAPVKVGDPALRALIDEALAKREGA